MKIKKQYTFEKSTQKNSQKKNTQKTKKRQKSKKNTQKKRQKSIKNKKIKIRSLFDFRNKSIILFSFWNDQVKNNTDDCCKSHA